MCKHISPLQCIIISPQVISLVKFTSKFLDDNPLMVCSEEVTFIKKSLADGQDDLKIRQKSGVLRYKIGKDRYEAEILL